MSATLQRPPTRSGSLLPDARELVLPAGIVGSAFPAVQATCRQIGIEFDDWQRDLNRCILAKTGDGLYAADTVAFSVARQVGKTYDIGALVFADSIINPGTTTVWTAHRFKVARETFDSLRSMARSPLLEAHIDADAITSAAGNETIPFRNGSRIVFAARERGAIRGFTKVRRLILDEAQILTESALSDMVPTLNQATNPQVILMGTPPKPTDPSEVWTNLRAEALAGTSHGVLYVELAAPAGSKPDDRHAWRVANPSFPKRTPAKAIERMRKLLTVEDFMREALGIWDDSVVAATISSSVWSSLAVDSVDVPDRGVRTYGVKFAVDGSSVAIAVAVNPKDGGAIHVELVDQQPLTGGIGWLVDWLAERASGAAEILIDGKGQSANLERALRDRGVGARTVRVPAPNEVIAAHASFLEAVKSATVSHFGQPELDRVVSVSTKRPIGTYGGWGWQSTSPSVDVSPLDAVTLAFFGAATTKRTPGRKAKVIV
jgi:hypothetical protein